MDPISQLAEWFATNPWIGFLGSLLAVLGLPITILLFMRGRKVRRAYYAMDSFGVIGEAVQKFESLKVLYSGKEIESLTVTRVSFWNAGNDTIDGQDVASRDPLLISLREGCEVLDAKVVRKSNQANGFLCVVASDRSNIKLVFDYMDGEEGVAVEFSHSGKSSEDVEFGGSIKGVGKPIRVEVGSSDGSVVSLVGFLVMVIAMSVMAGWIAASDLWPVSVFFLFLSFFVGYVFSAYPRRKIPKELR